MLISLTQFLEKLKIFLTVLMISCLHKCDDKNKNTHHYHHPPCSSILPSVTISFKVKVQLKNVIIELTSETMPVGAFPFAINNLESDIFVRWTGFETQDSKIGITFRLCLWQNKYK